MVILVLNKSVCTNFYVPLHSGNQSCSLEKLPGFWSICCSIYYRWLLESSPDNKESVFKIWSWLMLKVQKKISNKKNLIKGSCKITVLLSKIHLMVNSYRWVKSIVLDWIRTRTVFCIVYFFGKIQKVSLFYYEVSHFATCVWMSVTNQDRPMKWLFSSLNGLSFQVTVRNKQTDHNLHWLSCLAPYVGTLGASGHAGSRMCLDNWIKLLV